ncbi:MAG: hypothetical protein LBC98_07980 [Prevotellaceae bacterium]|jgi:hypothetical protein|nr:hypothetical protein [Prevotellaceae bacterium]
MYKKVIRYILIAIALVPTSFFLLSAWFYATCPIYKFSEPSPFTGEKLYNPYQNIDSTAWKKCIFHLHTKSWMGLTNGKNSFDDIIEVYRKLRYDVITISDYMKINRSGAANPTYIPTYEHGYGTKKAHQLVLGASEVTWRDYFFSQNLNQKQHIIDVLKKHCRLLAINHPNIRTAYLPADFKYLSGYDLFELQNGVRLSEIEWDSALSHGHQAWLIANDDAHSVDNLGLVQREMTFVNAPTATSENILENLAKGAAFGLHIPHKKHADIADKLHEAELISMPVAIKLSADTLQIAWRRTMSKIDFVGQGGQILKEVNDTCSADYLVKPEDHYVRIRLFSPEGLVYYINPIIRYTGDSPEKQMLSSIDETRTLIKRVLILIITLLGIGIIAIKQIKRLKHNRL